MTIDKRLYGINFGIENSRFFVEYNSVNRSVGNLKQEFYLRAVELYEKVPNLMLGLSSGLDSQVVLDSFYKQGIPLECAFLYLENYNTSELSHLKILEKKYNFKSIVINLDVDNIKDEIMDMYEKTGLPPNQLIHRMFVDKLPPETNLIQGTHGPDFLYKNNKWFIIESANSFEIARLRSLAGNVIGWERTPEIMMSLLEDDVVKAFMCSFDYIKGSQLMYRDGTDIPFIDYWDLYLKPFIYGKYWGDELEYFPKYQGPEGIDWIMNGPIHQYDKNVTAITYQRMIEILKSTDNYPIRIYQVDSLNSC
jgi:hypothetical protein